MKYIIYQLLKNIKYEEVYICFGKILSDIGVVYNFLYLNFKIKIFHSNSGTAILAFKNVLKKKVARNRATFFKNMFIIFYNLLTHTSSIKNCELLAYG